MENLYLLHNGEKVIFTKLRNGNNGITLPLSVDEVGNYSKNTVEHDSIGWRISSREIVNKNAFSNVWITNHGDICYNSNENPETVWLGEKIDPDKQIDDPIYRRAQELYEILAQNLETIIAYQDAEFVPSQVIDLRRKALAVYIKLLGYNSISDVRNNIEPSGEFVSLSNIGERLANYKKTTFVRNEINLLGNENYAIDFSGIDLTGEKNVKEVVGECSELVKTLESEFQKDSNFIVKRNEILDRGRSLSGDYFLNMKDKVTVEEWKKYHSTVVKVAKLIMGLNYDVLSKEDREGIEDLSKLSQAEIEDEISQVIDDRNFDDACNIENQYATSETEQFEVKIDELTGSSISFRTGELAKSLKELKDEAIATRTEKKSKIEAFNQMNQMYLSATRKVARPSKEMEE